MRNLGLPIWPSERDRQMEELPNDEWNEDLTTNRETKLSNEYRNETMRTNYSEIKHNQN